MIATFVDGARSAGLSSGVIAPVRPTWKERYPLISIEEYMGWRRGDGTHFDPWLRIHELVGGEIIAAAPASMVVPRVGGECGGVDRRMLFPGPTAEYVFPGRTRHARGRGRDRHGRRRAERLGSHNRV
jgi:hypothetical protein